ncbi:hypothetical protein [Teichococcus deserti]|uniref:hypothetical protein n=1 Tax=Teichococcus deserti TaxID=1817963 RepID=UPI001054CE66|nr:hypothetical protein [Pseudoroseomonas deserti]
MAGNGEALDKPGLSPHDHSVMRQPAALAGVGSPDSQDRRSHHMGRGILLWLLGIPIPVIIILMLLFR